MLRYCQENDVIFVKCDVTDAEQFTEAFNRAVREFGAVEICVNNAGIEDERIPETMIAINQTATIRGSLLSLEHMRRDKGGRGGVIINTSSTNGLIYGQSRFPVYMSTKRAIVAFTTAWANNPDQKTHDVRWAVVSPCWVLTPLSAAGEEAGIKAGRRYPPPIIPEGYDHPNVPQEIWLRPIDAALGYMTVLDDDDSNGYVIMVDRDMDTKRLVLQEIMKMDKSRTPIESLVLKKRFFVPPVVEPGTPCL
ncbi:15-hydroxyprostaglandin dehydrogenase [NAD(+)]-like isoform X2 [Littorina saxatilis]|uniref:15-hydroxyprostaglandin dehydrogenase [NAD(+)] n=2 Tax=Littorina saxatilis TaxID=31220 RepID=A0AAN9AZU0_9CAEN